jgi:hypothetical protein
MNNYVNANREGGNRDGEVNNEVRQLLSDLRIAHRDLEDPSTPSPAYAKAARSDIHADCGAIGE